jgi:hypothetical protein
VSLFDSQWLTALSESDSRYGTAIDTLQTHHTAYPSLEGSRALMNPGGRTVSANGLLDVTGWLYEVVQLDRRAFTSASGFDRRCLTVETVNSTGSPHWGIDPRSRERLAQLMVAMFRAGMLRGLYYGVGGIIEHKDVPGSYATACAGPSMDTAWIIARANEIYALSNTSQESSSIMSTLPIVMKIVNKDNGGLAGVHVLLGEDHGYVYPGDQQNAITTVAAPYFNNGVATPGSKIATKNGEVVLISQDNLQIIMRNLGYKDGTVEKLATSGGGHFYR